jgi:polysaccharide biosynthesis protein PslF
MFPVGRQEYSGRPTVSILSAYPPTPCGFATFTAYLARGLEAEGVEVSVVRIFDGSASPSPRVVGEMVNGSPKSIAACAEILNRSDVAVVQHEFGLFGGADGDEVLDVVDALRVPLIVIVHTVPLAPTPHQRSVLEALAARSDRLIVTSLSALQQLSGGYAVDRSKVVVIPQGLTVPNGKAVVRGGRPTVLTWGLLGPGKGIERVIDAMVSLHSLPGRPRYLIAGPTDPKELAAHGEAYRDALKDQVRRNGLEGSVVFDESHRGRGTLAALVQSAAVVVLPYDSTDQVSSGALVDTIAAGRPIVATAFPHAVELLSCGAGTIVDHDDPDAMALALFQVLTQPRLAGTMAAAARQLAPEMSWPVIAAAYHALVRRVLGQRQRSR